MHWLFLQPEIPLFGPHDTSRVSESDIPSFTPDGKIYLKSIVNINYVVLGYSQLNKWKCTLRLLSELSTKKGALFSEEEQGEEVDMHKMMGLVVSAKITLFEVRTMMSGCVLAHEWMVHYSTPLRFVVCYKTVWNVTVMISVGDLRVLCFFWRRTPSKTLVTSQWLNRKHAGLSSHFRTLSEW